MTHVKFLGPWKQVTDHRWVRHYQATYSDGFKEQNMCEVVEEHGEFYVPSLYEPFSSIEEAKDEAEMAAGLL